MKPTIILDFDFTISDCKQVFLDLYNKIATKIGGKIIDAENINALQDLSLKQAGKELNLNAIKVIIVSLYIKYYQGKYISEMKVADGMREVLQELKNKGYKIGILSSNSKKNIQKFIKEKDLNLFDFIYTNRNLFGKHETMKKIITKENCPSVIYVGDEVRDVEAMRILEIPVISVDWGLSSRNSLLKINPDYVVSLAPEVLQKIQILENILV